MYLLSKLQKVQNNAVRLIFRTSRSARVNRMLHSLHCLPFEQKIEYKLYFLCFKIVPHQDPIHLSERLHLYTRSRQLRSSADTRLFRTPSFQTKSCDQRSFSHQAPLSGTNSLFLSIIQPLSVLLSLPWKPFSFQKPFLRSHCPEI